MFFKRSPFQFAWKNSFIHKIDQDFILMSENNEEIDDYAAQVLEIMNTMEATKHIWPIFAPVNLKSSSPTMDSFGNSGPKTQVRNLAPKSAISLWFQKFQNLGYDPEFLALEARILRKRVKMKPHE